MATMTAATRMIATTAVAHSMDDGDIDDGDDHDENGDQGITRGINLSNQGCKDAMFIRNPYPTKHAEASPHTP